MKKVALALYFFSKSSMMDPHFGPAWIGFAHTFAAEGEHDQAVAAYSTAARLFQGTHLPQLFLGMQEIALGNLTVAREYLTAAYQIFDQDPLLINEIGVISYMEGEFNSASDHFLLALRIAETNESPPQQYTSTRLNLAHALRSALRFQEALEQFDEVIRLGVRDTGIFTSKALVLLELDQPFEATVALHEALAISPQDPIATELLSKALALMEETGVLGGADEGAIDESLQNRLIEAKQQRVNRGLPGGRTRRAPRRLHDLDDDMDLDGARNEV